MVKHCINPDCRAEFKLYTSGFLYAHERPSQNTEFFWICTPCSTRFVPTLDDAGHVTVQPRTSGTQFLPPRRNGDLRVVSMPAQRLPWRRSVPAGERIPPVGAAFLDRSTNYSVA